MTGLTGRCLFVWQRKMLCDSLKEPQFAQLDHNVYVQNPAGRTLAPDPLEPGCK